MSTTTGIVLGVIGGMISILIGLFMPILYPEFYIFGEAFVTIFQTVVLIGGILCLIGSFITFKNLKIAWILVLVGAILGGGNIICIIGAVQIKKEI